MMKRRLASPGFTLIEAVIVLVVVGILAAVAMPRFVTLQAEARAAQLQGVAAAGNSAIAAIYAKAAALGLDRQPASTITLNGQSISLVYGSPSLLSAIAVMDINPISAFTTGAVSGTSGYLSPLGVVNSNTCRLVYTQGSASAPARVDSFLSDCR